MDISQRLDRDSEQVVVTLDGHLRQGVEDLVEGVTAVGTDLIEAGSRLAIAGHRPRNVNEHSAEIVRNVTPQSITLA